MTATGGLSGHKLGSYRAGQQPPPNVQRWVARGVLQQEGRESGSERDKEGEQRDCPCSSTQLQMPPPSPHPLSLTFQPFLSSLSLFLFYLNSKECVTRSHHRFTPTTHLCRQKPHRGPTGTSFSLYSGKTTAAKHTRALLPSCFCTISPIKDYQFCLLSSLVFKKIDFFSDKLDQQSYNNQKAQCLIS